MVCTKKPPHIASAHSIRLWLSQQYFVPRVLHFRRLPRGATRTEISYAIAVRNHGNQSEITEIWLEIRNQGLGNPVEIRKSARNREKSGKKSREITRNHEKSRETPLSMRSRPFAHAHLRNPREISHEGGKSVGNQLEITEIRKSRTPRRPVSVTLAHARKGLLYAYECIHEVVPRTFSPL